MNTINLLFIIIALVLFYIAVIAYDKDNDGKW